MTWSAIDRQTLDSQWGISHVHTEIATMILHYKLESLHPIFTGTFSSIKVNTRTSTCCFAGLKIRFTTEYGWVTSLGLLCCGHRQHLSRLVFPKSQFLQFLSTAFLPYTFVTDILLKWVPFYHSCLHLQEEKMPPSFLILGRVGQV